MESLSTCISIIKKSLQEYKNNFKALMYVNWILIKESIIRSIAFILVLLIGYFSWGTIYFSWSTISNNIHAEILKNTFIGKIAAMFFGINIVLIFCIANILFIPITWHYLKNIITVINHGPSQSYEKISLFIPFKTLLLGFFDTHGSIISGLSITQNNHSYFFLIPINFFLQFSWIIISFFLQFSWIIMIEESKSAWQSIKKSIFIVKNNLLITLLLTSASVLIKCMIYNIGSQNVIISLIIGGLLCIITPLLFIIHINTYRHLKTA